MENTIKYNVAKLKSEIKVLAETQKDLKNQRRTVKLLGERTIDPEEATYKHMSNREILRAMYGAYGLARGKSLSQTENKYSEENHPLKSPNFTRKIDSILKGSILIGECTE